MTADRLMVHIQEILRCVCNDERYSYIKADKVILITLEFIHRRLTALRISHNPS